ncbi:MAG: D-alanyl-D-alanine carboxypeptidase [Acidimicrobiaceae bacterium]|nr:D-alanyl-D-alanine carboxypeptidase [Acidimicrobiaceae bacterium]
MKPLIRRILTLAALAPVLALLAAAWPAAATAQQNQPAGQWRERLIAEFSAAVSGRGAPADVCLSLYLNGEPLHESGAAASFAPASVMKLATAAVALEVMGPDATYVTEAAVGVDALDEAGGGVLRGDLYLIGGGDPTLSTLSYAAAFRRPRPYTDANELADAVTAALRARGISVIDGAVVGDESRYPEAERDYVSHLIDGQPVWKASYRDTNLSGPLSALMINDGYRPHRSTRRGHSRPADVAQAAAAEFDDLLEERGMVIRRRPRSDAAPPADRRVRLAGLESIPISQIVERMLTHSDNTTSEMVLKEIGHRKGDSSRAGAAAAAAETLRAMLGEEAAASMGSLRWEDGSGLSVLNAMNCDLAARLLASESVDSVLVRSLAVAGKTGTLRNCGPAPAVAAEGDAAAAPRNTVAAKTGALNDSDALAGVAAAPNGDVVAFAMIASEPLIIRRGSCNPQRRALITAAADYTYGPARAPDNDGDAGGDRTSGQSTSPPAPASGSGSPAKSAALLLDSAPDDVAADGVHAPAVLRLVEAGAALACDDAARLFCPGTPIPRAEVAWYLVERLQLQAAPTTERFSDVAADDPFAGSIAALAHAGVTQGCDSGRFCPRQSLTRAQMASLLVRALGLPTDSDSDERGAGAPDAENFSDVSADSVHAGSIAALARAGITKGCNSETAQFCPQRLVTRAEFASFLSRARPR